MNSAKVKPENVSLHPKKSPNKPPDYCNIASLANYSILTHFKINYTWISEKKLVFRTLQYSNKNKNLNLDVFTMCHCIKIAGEFGSCLLW